MTHRITRAGLAAALLVSLMGAAAAATESKPRFKGWTGPKPQIDCRCRLPDGKAALGSVRCIERNGERFTARCEMPQNLPFWRTLRKGCDELSS